MKPGSILLACGVVGALIAVAFFLTAPVRATPRAQLPDGVDRPVDVRTSSLPLNPLICGANLDPPLAANLTAAKLLGLTTVRFPDDANYGANLSATQSAGLQPLIILHGSGISDPAQRLATDLQLVSQAQSVFTTTTRVMYEIGNENDLQSGLSATDYVTMWNALVPQLKQLAPTSWFGGPVNYQSNPAYAATLVQQATPAPDFVSWHEYTCSSATPGGTCIAGIANWSAHVASTIAAIQANGNAVPPILITEWNYSPDSGVASDDKHDNITFLAQWTTTALQAIIQNNIYASYQFDVSGAIPLLNGPQGLAFQSVCQPTPLNGGGTNSGPSGPYHGPLWLPVIYSHQKSPMEPE